MALVGIAIVTAAATGGASGHTNSSPGNRYTWSRVGQLAVPTPPGFERRRWHAVLQATAGMLVSGSTVGGLSRLEEANGYIPKDSHLTAFSVVQGHWLRPAGLKL